LELGHLPQVVATLTITHRWSGGVALQSTIWRHHEKSQRCGSALGGFCAIGVLNLLPNKAAAADDPCTGCFIIAQWYWENEADMSSGEIQEWLAVCLDAHDC
jgi:hypothetical protein